ncbi:MAG TPA: PQQ-binding-like beta-propeller repeat protein [Phycisphaerae bacterium]|nr:PQQ-binding-like beta-propeller repeat protein [Phycisphaerae bacterium]
MIQRLAYAFSFFILSSPAAMDSVVAGQNWPQWRGPDLCGRSDSTNLPETWSETENVLWKTPMPSWAGSTPVIWGDHIFLTSPSSAEEGEPGGEIGRKLKSMPVNVSEPGGKDVLLVCINTQDGAIRWQRKLGGGNRFYAKHNMASPSPVTDGRHVWAVTGTGLVKAYDFDGKRIWTRDLQKDYGEFGLYWGYASSPLLYKDKLIVEVLHGSTNENPSYLAAFDKATGKTIWKVERKTDAVAECPDAYTTPTVLRGKKRDLLVVSGADYVTAHDPKNGTEVWRAGGLNPEKQKNYRVCGSPTVVGDTVVATSRERPIVAIRAGGRGDVTEKRTAWTYDGRKGPDVPSAATDGNYLYLIHDNGFATCLNVESGKEVWEPKRIEHGPYSASPLAADGKVYITNEDATTTVLAAGPEFKVLHVNRLEGGYTLSSFAVSGKRLYLRTANALYCIGAK